MPGVVESASVVMDCEVEEGVVAAQLDPDRSRLRVAGSIRNGLGDDPVGRDVDGGREVT